MPLVLCVRLMFLFLCYLLMAASSLQAQQLIPTVIPKIERNDFDMREVVVPPQLTEAELRGRSLFAQRCYMCHEGHEGIGGEANRPSGPWLDQETINKRIGETGVREKIAAGSRQMPGWSYALTPAQIDQIVAFLKTVTPNDKPKPPGP